MVSHLVITLAIGQEAEELYTLSSNSIQSYARKIGADFACIHQDVFSNPAIPPHYSKLKIGDYLEIYDRVLYLDCDLIVKPYTPNIFDLVPMNVVGVLNEGDRADYSQEIENAKEALGQLENWQKDYFNSGVMVVSKMHHRLFETPKKIFASDFYEQTYLNWKFFALNYEIKYIPEEFNYIFRGSNLKISESAYIVHFAGWGFNLPKSQNSHKHTYKYHQMQCFLDYLEGNQTIRIHPQQLSLKSGYISTEEGLKKLVIPANNYELISYGPYIQIKQGQYKIFINFKLTNSIIAVQMFLYPVFRFDIVSNSGNKIWHKNDVYSDSSYEIKLRLEDIADLEFRFYGNGIELEINFIEIVLINN